MVTMTSESDKRQSCAIPAINVNATSVILPKKLRSPTLGDAPNILVYKKVLKGSASLARGHSQALFYD